MSVVDGKKLGGLMERTLNHVDPRLIGHGKRVAFLTRFILAEDGRYTAQEMDEIYYLALLHDVGAYKTEEIDEMIRFETGDVWEHSLYGYLFIHHLSPLKAWGEGILFHHLWFDQMTGDEGHSYLAQVIHLADRVEIFVAHGGDIELLSGFLANGRGTRFDPKVVDCFLAMEEREGLVARMINGNAVDAMLERSDLPDDMVDAFLIMLVDAIDFRSHHTVTHTINTTAISLQTARMMGLEEETQRRVAYGALLHDMGKIGIPTEILEFSGKLSNQAMVVMRTHVDLTREIIGDAVDAETMEIVLRHHEKLDGSGYPRGLVAEELTIAQRIVAVADILSALSGTRSYKDAYPKERTLGIIGDMATKGLIDSTVVAVIVDHFEEILAQSHIMCAPQLAIYQQLISDYNELLPHYKTRYDSGKNKSDTDYVP